jgi:hypothetical protein
MNSPGIGYSSTGGKNMYKKTGNIPGNLLTSQTDYGKIAVRTMGDMTFWQLSPFDGTILSQYGAPVKG